MNRREFIGSSAAIIAASRLSRYESLASQVGAGKRVGVIGPGWYGKTDLLRLVQVAPVNVVSMCDVDSRMLNDAADLVAAPAPSVSLPAGLGLLRRAFEIRCQLVDPFAQLLRAGALLHELL